MQRPHTNPPKYPRKQRTRGPGLVLRKPTRSLTYSMLTAALLVPAGLPNDANAAAPAQRVELSSQRAGTALSGKVALQATFDREVDKVTFELAGPASLKDTERSAPFYFGGDKSGQPNGWDTTTVPDGSYTLTVKGYEGRSTVVAQQTHRFEVRNTVIVQPTPAEPVALTGTVTGVQNGATVDGELFIKSDVFNDVPANVVFEVTGPVSVKHTESVAPYYFKGDRRGEPNGWDTNDVPDGDYVLKVLADDQLIGQAIRFSVDNVPDTPLPTEPKAEPSVPVVEEPVAPTNPTPTTTPSGGTTITGLTGVSHLQPVNGIVTITAPVTGPTPDRVDFALQGPRTMSHRERVGPYVFGGDNAKWDTTKFPNGRYKLTAVAYLGGKDVSRTSVIFHVKNLAIQDTAPIEPVATPAPTTPTPPQPEPTVPEPTVTEPTATPNPGGVPNDPTPQPVPDDATVLNPGGSANTDPSSPLLNQIGSGYAANKEAIARWDVVPWQSFDQPFAVGVLAFHINRIDRVEFSVNGGAWTAVTETSVNPRTGVEEYVAVLDPAKLPTGKVTVQAIAYPRAGVPMKVHVTDGTTLTLYNDRGNALPDHSVTLNPGQDIGAAAKALQDASKLDGATIYLREGKYGFFGTSLGSANSRWFTVTAAPGADPSKVIINGENDRLKRGRLRLHNLTLQAAIKGNGNSSFLWVDNVEYFNPKGKADNWSDVKDFDGGEWWTDSYVHDLHLAGVGDFVRNTVIEDIGEDVLRSFYLVVDTTIRRVYRPAGTKWHSDITGRPENNTVVFRTRIEDSDSNGSGVFAGGGGYHFKNVAVVESYVDNPPKAFFYGSRSAENLLENFMVMDSQYFGKNTFRDSDRFKTKTDVFAIINTVFNGDPAERPSNWEAADAVFLGTVSAD